MARAAPQVVRDAAMRLGLGSLQERYAYRTLLLWFVPVPGLATLGMSAGGYWFAWLFGAVTVTLVAWDLLTRRNRAIYLYEGGIVYVNLFGRLQHAAWRDVADVTRMNVRVSGQGPSFMRHDYVVVFAGGGGVDFNTVVVRGADELAARASKRRFDAKLRRLNAGEEVAFGRFVVTPSTLTWLPAPRIGRNDPPPPDPVTVPWSRVTGARVHGDEIVVGVAGPGPDLAAVVHGLLSGVTDPDLFLAVVEQRAGRP